MSQSNTASSLEALLASSILISQGAEAKVYKGRLTPQAEPILLKYRFRKNYRHPTLDSTLTRSRLVTEGKIILKCLRAGVNVPGIRMADAAAGLLGLEWIEGGSIRNLLPGGLTDEQPQGNPTVNQVFGEIEGYGISTEGLMSLIGTEIGKMHAADVVHGDLTTSNMMLRHPFSYATPVQSTKQLVGFLCPA